ncbi:hypothetical protein BBB57_03965 [Kosakonia sacchari]|nr:hypothetical protein C813_24565 [Kosakonia sacchari SP1]ANR77486.1 hypothetical protein BBB57_03965 [Kosakonia sacchari]
MNVSDIAKSVPVLVAGRTCTRMVINAPAWRFFSPGLSSLMRAGRGFGADIALNTDLDQGFVGLWAKRRTLCMVIRA